MTSQRWVMGGGTTVLLIVLVPLWGELREPAHMAWNVFLAALLVAIAVGAFLLQRYLRDHIGDVGEARFDTRNKIDE